MTVCVAVCVVWLCCEGWWWKEGRRWNTMPAHSLLFSKSTKGPPGLTSPSVGLIAINSTIMHSQHTYCGRVWNLIQVCDVQSSDYKVDIFTVPSPRRGSNPGLAEPEADMLPPEPARRATSLYCLKIQKLSLLNWKRKIPSWTGTRTRAFSFPCQCSHQPSYPEQASVHGRISPFPFQFYNLPTDGLDVNMKFSILIR